MFHQSRSLSIALIAIASVLLQACGGGNGDTAKEEQTAGVRQGVFMNSAVEGLRFQTATLEGLTTSEGQFRYRPNETVLFSIGSIELGSAPGASVLTPLDLVPDASGVDHPTVTNLTRFLQSLDEDYFPENGIRILPSVHEALQYSVVDFDVPIDEFETVVTPLVSLVAETHMDGPRSMVPTAQARERLEETLGAIDGTVGGHRISPQFIFEPELTHAFFRMSDDIRILSLDTIEIKFWIYSY